MCSVAHRVFFGMRFHLGLAPIKRLPEAVHILKHGIVSDRLCIFPFHFILDQSDLDLFIQRIIGNQFSFLDSQDIQLPVLAGAEGKLDITLVAQLKLRLCFLGLTAVKRHHVILSELRRGGELQ